MKRTHVSLSVLLTFFSLSVQASEGDDELAVLNYIDTFPPPSFLEGVGSSHLTITTDSEDAQRYFDQGLSLIHCFWDFEALRAFRQVVRLDPDAAMGYWGIYRALQFDPGVTIQQRKQILSRASELSEGASEQEQYYIRAEGFRAERDEKRYIQEMEALINRYPDDVEAKILLASVVRSGYDADGNPREGHLYSLAILGDLLRTHPDHHAVNHYWVHALEASSRPDEAVEAANRLAGLAPASGHIVHMPGHVYYQIGDYEKAHQSFMDSMEADSRYMKANGIEPINTWNYIHNLDYLVANCAEDGRYREGEKWAKVLQALKLSQPSESHSPHHVSERGQVRMARGRFAFVEFYLRYGNWDKAVAVLESVDVTDAVLPEQAKTYRLQLLHYVRAMEALEQGDAEAAKSLANALDAELWQGSLRGRPEGARFGEASTMVVYSLELRGYLASERGDYTQAVEWMERAARKRLELGEGEPPRYARPVNESLALVHLKARKWDEARKAYDAVLKMRPNTGHALYGIARSYELEGKREEASRAYRRFLEAWSHADDDLPQVQQARKWLGM